MRTPSAPLTAASESAHKCSVRRGAGGKPAGADDRPPRLARIRTTYSAAPRVGSDSVDGDPLDGDDFEQVFTLAHRCARQHGLSPDDADDCAMEFVLRFLGRVAPPGGFPGMGWLYRCASNHTKDFCRVRTRLRSREASGYVDDPDRETLFPMEQDGNPLATFLRAACREQIMQAISQLAEGQRALFVRHHLGDESIASLAAASGRSPHAVEQTLFRARQRIRSLLERRGWSEPELRRCLNESTALAGSASAPEAGKRRVIPIEKEA